MRVGPLPSVQIPLIPHCVFPSSVCCVHLVRASFFGVRWLSQFIITVFLLVNLCFHFVVFACSLHIIPHGPRILDQCGHDAGQQQSAPDRCSLATSVHDNYNVLTGHFLVNTNHSECI